ncbi:hypothetical protein JYU34_000221 [Plutella xylostella]|uniref:Uncharacterized protein n=1 Tax=Plutella xylostella TaxID=51655 RepID=A0ABQ7R757_PLUXY|nr:hypothetical protein JYU34_000221 [Plutella xylostella]
MPAQRNASTPRAAKTTAEAASTTKTAADAAAAALSPATSPTPAPRTLLASPKPPASRVPPASTMLPASTVSPTLSASPAPTASLVQPTLSESCESLSLEDVVLGEAAADGPAAVAGDTQRELLQETITYDRFSALLDAKLDSKFATIRTCLLAEIKNMIATEIKNATVQIKTETEKLTTQQKKTEENIKSLNEKIEHIEHEREKLQRQVQELYNTKNEDLTSVKNDITKCKEKEYSKKIVVHGIRDSYNENKHMLEETVSRAMYDIMNINIHGHIEDIRRIGKRGQCRPIEIELISKRMITYILEHAEQFKNAGLSVTPFLDEETLKERKRLSELLRTARKNNHHAVIRHNTLFIDGKEYNGQQEPANDLNEQSRPNDTQEQVTPTSSSAQITQRRPNSAPTIRHEQSRSFRNSMPKRTKH